MKKTLVLAAFLMLVPGCAPQIHSESGSGPDLRVSGPTAMGEGGATRLSATGTDIGTISWKVVPAEAGILVDPLVHAASVATGSTPPPLVFAMRQVSLVAGHDSAVVEVSANSRQATLTARATLRITRGIAITLDTPRMTVAPSEERWVAWRVTHPTLAASELPQALTWTALDDLKDGWIRAQAYTDPWWVASVAFQFRAPSTPGVYRLEAHTPADPAASAVLEVTVR